MAGNVSTNEKGEFPLGAEAWERDLPPLSARATESTNLTLRNVTVLDLLRETVSRYPLATAISDAKTSITYRQLWNFAAAFRCRLVEQGVQPGDLVSVVADRSLPTVAAILGIVMAGGCYVPIDIQEIPAAVLGQLTERSRMRAWIADAHALQTAKPDLWQQQPMVRLDEVALPASHEMAEIPPVALTPDSPLYIMFTSGSTGLPKGVVVPHRAVVRLVLDQTFMQFGPEQTFFLHSPLSFDASTLELWGGLLHGSRLVLAPACRLGLEETTHLLAGNGVTTLWLTAAMFHLAAEHAPEMFAPLRQLLFGGDVISPRHVERIRKLYPSLHMVNGYGPTENTTFTCCYVVPADYRVGETLPIGLPIAHTTLHVLDADHHPVEVGQEGELAAGGAGVALGYLGQPEATAERFLLDTSSEIPGARLYRTGDRVRQRHDGVVEFLGRMDRQIKISGHRVELAAIESALASSPLVAEAAVVVLTSALGEKRLAACVSLVQPWAQKESQLRKWLSERMSRAEIPQHWIFLEKLPINSNGKLDRAALQVLCEAGFAPQVSSAIRPAPHPSDEPEMRVHLQQMWAHLLGRATVEADENFFDLGGTSLLLIEMHARLKAQFAATPSLVDMFAFPTPRSLAQRLCGGPEISHELQAAGLRGQLQREAMLARRSAMAPSRPRVAAGKEDGR